MTKRKPITINGPVIYKCPKCGLEYDRGYSDSEPEHLRYMPLQGEEREINLSCKSPKCKVTAPAPLFERRVSVLVNPHHDGRPHSPPSWYWEFLAAQI